MEDDRKKDSQDVQIGNLKSDLQKRPVYMRKDLTKRHICMKDDCPKTLPSCAD